MLKTMLTCVMCLGMVAPIAAGNNDSLARFDGGIGVIPVSSGVGTLPTATDVNRNIVRGVQPPGQIWVIRALKADVAFNGQITVRGRGLLLGGGNTIGTNAGASVFATLTCAVNGPRFSTDLAGVALAANGDFRIDDVLEAENGVAVLPAQCASPVLLIRNAGNQAWFAAGIPDLDDDN